MTFYQEALSHMSSHARGAIAGDLRHPESEARGYFWARMAAHFALLILAGKDA